ncbi:hypothetical protein HK096_008571, partial [Nowakowskiella sp. JEL0078]
LQELPMLPENYEVDGLLKENWYRYAYFGKIFISTKKYEYSYLNESGYSRQTTNGIVQKDYSYQTVKVNSTASWTAKYPKLWEDMRTPKAVKMARSNSDGAEGFRSLEISTPVEVFDRQFGECLKIVCKIITLTPNFNLTCDINFEDTTETNMGKWSSRKCALAKIKTNEDIWNICFERQYWNDEDWAVIDSPWLFNNVANVVHASSAIDSGGELADYAPVRKLQDNKQKNPLASCEYDASTAIIKASPNTDNNVNGKIYVSNSYQLHRMYSRVKNFYTVEIYISARENRRDIYGKSCRNIW